VLPRADVIVVAAGAACGLTYWIAHYNNRAPTPIDGAWSVATPTGDASHPRVTRVFFEYNRAHLVVLRRSDGSDAWHHFEVTPDGRVQIWKEWLAKGDLVMEGRVVAPDAITLTVPGAAETLNLTREQ
jgi:hypothetical protein